MNENINHDSDELNLDYMKNESCARFLLTNARWLQPKIYSLVDAFSSLQLHFACITETWFKGGRDLSDTLTELEGASGIRTFHKSRDGRTNKRGGGVAIAINMSSCNFKQRHLKHIQKEHEVVCATGRVGKVSRRIVVFAAYVPPNIKAPQFEALKEAISTEVSAVRIAYNNPIIIVAGDFNHRDLGPALNEVADVSLVQTPPTRGDSTIDLVYTNIASEITDTAVLPPLQSLGGVDSDHKCVFVAATLKEARKFKWTVKMKRSRDPKKEEAFTAELAAWNGDSLAGDADDMAEELERVIRTLTDKHFPLRRVRKRSNESPWITHHIRRLWKRKIRIYRKSGRNDQWWEIDRILQDKINSSREAFVEKMLEEGNSGRSFFAATRKLASATTTTPWTVRDLFPEKDPLEAGSEVLEYFGRIATTGANPMPEDIAGPGDLPEFTRDRTLGLLKSSKKTDSMVAGDPLPNLVRLHPGAFAGPISVIFNKINTTGKWPKKWKTEHLTVIPKSPNPTDLSECRNISGTSVFSKILEGEVLLKLRSELQPDNNQYGGIPKCGAEHMLVALWDKVLSAVEGGDHAAILLGVDYEKAFNRMNHAVCLRNLEALGALAGSLSLVRAFLEERTMTISIDGKTPQPVPILRGSPQGSVLGCALYCATTQSLTNRLRAANADQTLYFP